MARLRSTKLRAENLLLKTNINILTSEETTRFTHFFTLLVEIDVRLSKTAKPKTKKRATTKAKHKHPITPKPCHIKCPVMCCTRPAQRDLFLPTLNYC